MSDQSEKCSNCRYWKVSTFPGESSVGYCRACSPQAQFFNSNPGVPVGIWPKTGSDDWCGEYKPVKEEKDAKD